MQFAVDSDLVHLTCIVVTSKGNYPAVTRGVARVKTVRQ